MIPDASQTQTFEVCKTDLAQHRLTACATATPAAGEITVRIERFGLTANNITYGVVGERIGYWKFFPTKDSDWGVLPVWGLGIVEDSSVTGITAGERLFGYWPMASQVTLQPQKVTAERFFDGAAHRQALPAVYNRYLRLSNDPAYDPDLDDLRMVLWPLYATSYCLYDFAKDNDWFGAQQVLIVSASSKTGIGTAYALKEDPQAPPVLALTSAGNADKVRALDLYDQVMTYDDIETALSAERPTLIIDMSGSGPVINRLHRHLGAAMRYTSHVGLTHYDDAGMGADYIRDRSAMFFAPGHIAKRGKDWGAGEFDRRSAAFWERAAKASTQWLTLSHGSGAEAVTSAYQEVLEGRTPADRAWTLSMG
ncbi:DUF2855 family protein [Phaeobacter sp. PT47_59]|uniref:DUF2855 family protein n=1 Tax=Phaeobacter sp. PT47_59 TaxID=3029979 RepID=UPI00237FEFC8|nr:DUF2855 family protein [Phaeobacter sp. PT47_59]MDE4175815.1 DUF2855 family protein [Phaeobacter sp. PT47_59]